MKSKQWWFLVILVAVLTVGIVNMFASSHQKDKSAVTGSEKGVAVVELFTSEGCSSCPLADKLLSNLKDQGMDNVYFLAFHVDYWNYLGWKDRFSDASYSQRQQKYSKLLNSDVYTPQMVVNGSTQFLGSDEDAAVKAIKESLNNTSLVIIALTPHYNNSDKSVSVIYNIQGKTDNEVLNVALIQKSTQSDVSKGENSGRHLVHVNVVRDFQTVTLSASTGTVKVMLPPDVSIGDMQLIAYTQHSPDLKVTGAISVLLNSN